MPEPTPKPLTCPTCGAPLELDSDNPLVYCKSCENISLVDGLKAGGDSAEAGIPDEFLALLKAGNKVEAIKNYRERYAVSLERAKQAIDLIEAGQLEETEAGFEVQEETEEESQPVKEEAKVKAPPRWLGLAIPLVILVIVGGILGFVFLQPGGPLAPQLDVAGTAILLASEAGTLPDIVSQFYNAEDDTRLVGRLNGENGKLKWKTNPLPEGGSVDAMLVGDKRVFIVTGKTLLAYNSNNGRAAWQVEMPDKLDVGKQTLAAIDGYVLALTLDRSLRAYEAETGDLAWSKPLRGFFRGIWVFGESLAYVDYLEGGSDYSIIFINPADGSLLSTITPTCTTDQPRLEKLESDSGIVYDAAENSLYLVFGLVQGCVQRYDLESGEMEWQAVNKEEGFLLSSYGFNALMSETTLYFSYENRLFAVEKETGTLGVAVASYNYSLLPLAPFNDTLITQTRRIHGSESFEIWGLDPLTGESLWQVVLENGKPLDAPIKTINQVAANASAWTSRLTPAGLLVLEFRAEPNNLIIKMVNPLDGSISDTMTVDLADVVGATYSAPQLVGWQGYVVYFIIETRLYGLNASTGQVVLQY
jgi:outer membrane protein assembly factor BamB